MGLDVGVSDQNGVPVLTLAGDVDLASAGQLRDTLLDALSREPDLAVVDLREVGFLDSTGLGALATGLERAGETSTQLAVVCPSELRRLFKITGLDTVLSVVDSLDAALTAPSGE